MAETKKDTIEACLERIREGWNHGDAKAYAQEFTPDATYVIFLGDPILGRAEIEKTHHDVFTKWQAGTKMTIKILGSRSIDSKTVSVLTAGGIGKGDQIPFDKLQTFTLVNIDGRWKCAAFQNTKMSFRSKRQFNTDAPSGFSKVLAFFGR
jgi:uncharacterized protein (TIGR02246 family)